MNIMRSEASEDRHAKAFDTMVRSLHGQLPRRQVIGLLAAALATGVAGLSPRAENVKAGPKRGKRGKRRASRNVAVTERASVIPPNCIYVCCDGTCDSWKMCLRCVKWPKPPTTSTIAAR